ncbi:MAG: helix-turn-helix transcriptional regulator [Bacilli bacterium]|nr:helix-turn-helix transcriptional regulator [Bacilli bacterium]MBN2877248.1 helix-turn-helix transcriptional regulator [Bacilli bacterium]
MFFKKFKENRIRLDMTLEDVSHHLQVDLEIVEKWESGVSMPDLDMMIRLSDLFGMSIDSLLKDHSKETDFSYYTIVREKEEPKSFGKTIALTFYVLSVIGLFTMLILSIMQPMTYSDSQSGLVYTGIKAYCHAYYEFCIAYYGSIVGFVLSSIYLFVPDKIISDFFHKKN